MGGGWYQRQYEPEIGFSYIDKPIYYVKPHVKYLLPHSKVLECTI